MCRIPVPDLIKAGNTSATPDIIMSLLRYHNVSTPPNGDQSLGYVHNDIKHQQ